MTKNTLSGVKYDRDYFHRFFSGYITIEDFNTYHSNGRQAFNTEKSIQYTLSLAAYGEKLRKNKKKEVIND